MTPTMGSISVTVDNRVLVNIASMGGNALVRLDYAVGSVAPSQQSRSWLEAGSIEYPGDIQTPPLVPGSIVWLRVSGRTSTGARSSPYSQETHVEIAEYPAFTSVQYGLSTDFTPVVSWTNNLLVGGVRVSWAIHDVGDPPSSFIYSVDLDQSTFSYEISEVVQVGQAITINLEAWSDFDSGGVAGTQGNNQTGRLYRYFPTVAAHAIAHAVGQYDELDLGTCFITSEDGSRWQLVVNNSGELSLTLLS